MGGGSKAKAELIVKFRGAIVKEHVLDKPSIRIKRRDGNDIRIENVAMSGNCAKIEEVNGSYILAGLKSTSGIFVNKIVQARFDHLNEITIEKHTLVAPIP